MLHNVGMDDIVSLASSAKLPIPVVRQSKTSENGDGVLGTSPSGRYLSSLTQPPSVPIPHEPVAPYQALPITITHNITPALPVIDRDDLTPQVTPDSVGIFRICFGADGASPPTACRRWKPVLSE